MWRFDGRIMAACLSVCLPSFALQPTYGSCPVCLSVLSLPSFSLLLTRCSYAVSLISSRCCSSHHRSRPASTVFTAPNGQRNAQLTPFTTSHFISFLLLSRSLFSSFTIQNRTKRYSRSISHGVKVNSCPQTGISASTIAPPFSALRSSSFSQGWLVFLYFDRLVNSWHLPDSLQSRFRQQRLGNHEELGDQLCGYPSGTCSTQYNTSPIVCKFGTSISRILTFGSPHSATHNPSPGFEICGRYEAERKQQPHNSSLRPSSLPKSLKPTSKVEPSNNGSSLFGSVCRRNG